MRLQIAEVVSDVEHLKEEKIVKAIKKHKAIQEWVYILHDKDVEEDGSLKAPHWHIDLKLDGARETKQIAGWFGLEPNFVSKSTSKSPKQYRFNDMVAYLVHEGKGSTKYLYDISAVKTNITNYKERLDKYDEHLNGKPYKTKKISDERKELDEIINKIAQGEIKEYNYTDFIPGLMYAKHTREIKAAFEYRRSMIKNQQREMEVYYFSGDVGVGKSTYGQEIARNLGYTCFVSSSDNDTLDGYEGQEVILLDDLRPDSLKLSDLLKLLDNNTNSTVKSRFHNKVIQAKIIIITSVYSMEDFFDYTIKIEDGLEPIKQLRRRIGLYAEFDESKIATYIYNKLTDQYEPNGTFENPIKDMHPKLAPSDEQKTRLKGLFTNEIKEETKEKEENEEDHWPFH